MSLQHVKDTPTKRLFERKFQFGVARKHTVTEYHDQVAGIYQSGVPEIDKMSMEEECFPRLTIPEAAEMFSRGVKLRVIDPDTRAMEMFKLLLEHTEYVKDALINDMNVRTPDLEATRKLEAFLGMLWTIAKRRIKDPTELSGIQSRMGQVAMTRRSLTKLGRLGQRTPSGPTQQEQLRAIRRSEYKPSNLDMMITQRGVKHRS